MFLTKGKQYRFEIPYISYWGCDDYHWIRVHKKSWKSVLSNRVNGDTWFTITYNRGKFEFEKEK